MNPTDHCAIAPKKDQFDAALQQLRNIEFPIQ